MAKKRAQRSKIDKQEGALRLAENVVAAQDTCCDAEFSPGPEDYCHDCEMFTLCLAIDLMRQQLEYARKN